jgi:hypothetical protein
MATLRAGRLRPRQPNIPVEQPTARSPYAEQEVSIAADPGTQRSAGDRPYSGVLHPATNQWDSHQATPVKITDVNLAWRHAVDRGEDFISPTTKRVGMRQIRANISTINRARYGSIWRGEYYGCSTTSSPPPSWR